MTRKRSISAQKYIYWRPDMGKDERGNGFVNVHLLVGYNQGTITDFQEMAAELRKTFPQAKDDEIHCGKITESSSVKGFSLITWNTYLPQGEYPGWFQYDNGRMEYHW